MLKYKISRESLINIYFSFIRPVLEYGDVVWDNCTEEQSKLLESVQIEAARIITGLRRNSSVNHLYKELGWETLKTRRKNNKLILLFKIINNYVPDYLYDIIDHCMPTQHMYNLRQNNVYRIPVARTVSYFNSFVPSTIKLWNDLPREYKNSLTVSAFKKCLKKSTHEQVKKHKLYNHGNRLENVLHCQLRNNCSNLNADLFSHYLQDFSNCLYCDSEWEDPKHFFMHCAKYHSQREKLFHYMYTNAIPVNINNILYGCEDISHKENQAFFNEVHAFIKNSKRFIQ